MSTQANIGYVNPGGFQTRDLGRAMGAGLTCGVPLLAQGLVGSRVRAALAQRQAVQFRVEGTRRTVAATLLNTWNQIVTAQEQIRVGTAAVTAALDSVRRGFTERFRSNVEVIDSEQRPLNARVLVVNARYSLVAGQATMLASTGRLEAAALMAGVDRYDPTDNLERQRRDQFIDHRLHHHQQGELT